jgi:solute carrier family 34 (sodium-dependent phosphate cotransporter)
LGLLANVKSDNLIKPLSLILYLYIFLLSIALMGSSFKLLGHGFAETLVSSVSNPFTALLIGILATSIIQSSSATSSLVVGLVGGLGVAGAQAGGDASVMPVLTIQNAIPIIMGANIGTSVTNILVSLGHISHRAEFQRAFSAAIVHDSFNILAVAIFLPLQIATNFLGISAAKASEIFSAAGGLKFASPIKMITKPVVNMILDSPVGIGWLCIIIALALLFLSLNMIVRVLKSMVLNKVEVFFDKYIFKTAFRSLLLGLGLTVLVQSSSITTSLIIPLAGAGVLTLPQLFPYTLGANVGTTITAFLAALAIGRPEAVTIALAHVLFNVFGIVVIWPIKAIPLSFARWFSKMAMKNRLVPIIFLLTVFFLLPIALIFITR